MLTVLVSTISNSQVFLLITNDIVSFEQLGPGKYFSYFFMKAYVGGTHKK